MEESTWIKNTFFSSFHVEMDFDDNECSQIFAVSLEKGESLSFMESLGTLFISKVSQYSRKISK